MYNKYVNVYLKRVKIALFKPVTLIYFNGKYLMSYNFKDDKE